MNTKQAFGKAQEAVSPVVATLLLVLVAAGAAIGFGVFLNGFQNDAQQNVNSDVSSQCLTVAGSSTVFEFTAVAEPLFENSQGGCDLVNNAGGSGAGLQAIGLGNVDIGAMSHDPTSVELSKYPDLNADGKKDFGVPDLKVTRVGFDAVVSIVPTGSCSTGMTVTTEVLREIWSVNGYGNAPVATAGLDAPTASGKYAWANVDAFDAGCGAAYTDAIKLVSRSDKGGTVDVFCDKLVGANSADLCKAPVKAAGTGAIIITKFGSTDPLLGNQDAEARMAATDCAPSATTGGCLGYTSMAGDDTNSAITAHLLDSNNDADALDGVQATSTTVRNNSYFGWRSLVYLTIGEPSGVAKQYLDFVLLPKNNQEISVASGFVSLYP